MYKKIVYYFTVGGSEVASELRNELSSLRLKVENLDADLKSKNEEIQKLTLNRMPLEEKCKVIHNLEYSLPLV